MQLVMVEQTETNETASGAQENSEIPLAPAPGPQHALAFGPDGSAAATLEAADAHDGRRSSSALARRKSRFDTRRTAEYLAERGRLPAESLHLITRRSLPEAVAYIRKAVPGSDHQWAANYYLRCLELLAPFTHAPVKDLDLPAVSADAVLGIAGHFLAASAASARLAAGRGAGEGESRLSASLDGQRPLLQLDETESATGPATVSGTRRLLPPKGRD